MENQLDVGGVVRLFVTLLLGALVALGVAAAGGYGGYCYRDHCELSKPQAEPVITGPKATKAELLFSQGDTRVYRFVDEGRVQYFVEHDSGGRRGGGAGSEK